MIDEIESKLEKDSVNTSKEVDLKISKKSRDLLKLCKITMSKSSYDLVILELIKLYKNKIHQKDVLSQFETICRDNNVPEKYIAVLLNDIELKLE